MSATVEILGERLHLLPERAAYWEGAGTLLLADPHWGKAATFRAAGIPVPGGTTADGLDRLDAALSRCGASRVVFLGDFYHGRLGRSPSLEAELDSWRARNRALELVLVRGNHDRGAGDPPPELGIRCVEPPLAEPPFALAHFPDPDPSGYVLAGHLHPALALAGRGRQRERLPCFWIGARAAVLPAFGDFTGAATISPAAGDRVWVVAGHEVVQVRG